ncbi:MAG: hypothetical protein IBJ02_07800 [Brevundimonas sp.]|nr:hypothetical protein [Brevundimonas sp.]
MHTALIAGVGWAILALPAAAQTPEVLATSPAEPFLIESVARDPHGALVLSAIHAGGLFTPGETGRLIRWGELGHQPVFGLAIDASRGMLWAASGPAHPDETPLRTSGLLQIDADTGVVVASWDAPDGVIGLGDVAVAPDGSVFAADGRGGKIVVKRETGDHVERFLDLPERASPQGMVVSPDGQKLLFANYGSGLHVVDATAPHRTLTTETFTPLPAPEGVEMRGIDGLIPWGDRIIAIQNGTRTHRILLLTLDADWTRVIAREALLEGPPLEEPTTGFVEGDSLVLVARSQWTDFDAQVQPRSPTPQPAVVIRLPLKVD